MTIRLYDQDATLLAFTAVVRTCVEKNGQYEVTLDRTAFFPEGGGQGADHGTLGGVHVLDAHEKNGEVCHLTDGPLEVGAEVRGEIDAVRRMDMMQQHSGEHIFSGLVCSHFGYDNVGFHIGSEMVTMDFNGPMTEEEVHEIERQANQIIWKNVPVETTIPSKEELAHMEYRSKKELTGDVRIVHIEGADTCACCGTHVARTGQIGQVKVMGVMKYKSGVRISILCGRRALNEENLMQDQLHRSAVALSCKQMETADAVKRLLEERDRLRFQNEAMGLRIFEMMAEKEEANAVRVVACDALPASQGRKAAGRLCEGAKLGLVLVPREGGWSFALSSQTEDVRPATKLLCQTFNGRGGGPKDMTQGMLGECDPEAVRKVLETSLQ